MKLPPRALLCLQLIQAYPGKNPSRRWLAKRLSVHPVTVSRHIAALVREGYLTVKPPRREHTDKWRSIGFNRYTVLVPVGPGGRPRRSSRGSVSVTSPLAGLGVAARRGPKGPYTGPLISPADAIAVFLAGMDPA